MRRRLYIEREGSCTYIVSAMTTHGHIALRAGMPERRSACALFPCFATLLILFTYTAPAQFEGVFETKNLTTDEMGAVQKFSTTMWIKDGMAKIRNDPEGSTPSSTMIYRSDRQVIWLLNEADSSYVEIVQARNTPAELPPDLGSSYKIRRTRKTTKILGYRCQQVLIQWSEKQTELWGSDRLSKLAGALSSVLGSDNSQVSGGLMDEVEKLGLFPLRSITKIDGRVVESQEVTAIREKRLGNELFEIPVGYVKQSVDRILDDVPHEPQKK